MNDVTDHYAILGLAPGVPISQVRAQFRRLAMAVHPDRNENNPDCQEQLKRINAAYEYLSDPSRKSDYDACQRRQTSFHTSTGGEPGPRPLPSSRRDSAKSGSGATYFLALVVLCVFLLGIVAVVVIAGSSQPASNTEAAPAVVIISPPPDPADPAASAAPPVSVPTPDDTTAAAGSVPPVSEKSLRSVLPPEQPAAISASDRAPSESGPAATSGGAWPPTDTGSFPSH